jgi:hypothetical protein
MSTEDDRDELALEIDLDRLEAELAGQEPLRWTVARRISVARAIEVPGLRARALRGLQRWAPDWIDQAPVVAAARLAPASWTAYRKLRTVQDVLAEQLFGASPDATSGSPTGAAHDATSGAAHDATSGAAHDATSGAALGATWIDVMRWHGGVPAGELPAPSAIPAMAPAWIVGSLALPWRAWIDAFERSVLPALVAAAPVAWFGGPPAIEIGFSAERPRTRVAGGRISIGLRDERDMPRAWFQLLHELGHAVAAVLAPAGGTPRAVDEAVASWLARHLEEPGSVPALPQHAYVPALHGDERARREAVAIALAHLETHAHGGDEREPPAAASGAGLPWALWHDGGAQPSYLHAERLAARWWSAGLRLGSNAAAIARAVADACEEAAALPPPFARVRLG